MERSGSGDRRGGGGVDPRVVGRIGEVSLLRQGSRLERMPSQALEQIPEHAAPPDPPLGAAQEMLAGGHAHT